jgi:hypothetical protein
MFKENKYTKYYYQIIEKSKQRVIEGYKEIHHIIPRSMGGSDEYDNLATLTAREHFVCHLLLIRMTGGENLSKMRFAAWAMCRQKRSYQHRYMPSSRVYELLKIEHARNCRQLYTGIPGPNKGVPKTTEHRKNLSIANTGKKRSAESVAKQVKTITGRIRPPRSPEWIENLKKSIESNQKECEHCKKRIQLASYNRFHGDKCKTKN